MRIAISARLLVTNKPKGMERYMLEVLRYLLNTTEHNYLLITDRPGSVAELPRAVERQTVLPPTRHPILTYLWFERRVPVVLRDWKADAFLCLGNFCSLRTEVPTLLVIHDLAYLHLSDNTSKIQAAYYRYFMPRFARRAQALVTVSEYTRQDVACAYGIEAGAISVAYNGLRPGLVALPDAEQRSVRQKYSDGAHFFLYVGSVHPRKNVDGLVKAYDQCCTQLRTENAETLPRLLIAGDFAWKTERTKEAIDASPNKASIRILGYTSDEDLTKLLSAARVLCLVSFFEGFGVPLIEAMACGTPVITSNVSSLPEVAGAAGLLVDPHSISDIASALYQILTDDALHDQLSAAGLVRAQEFTWEKGAEAIRERMEGMVEGSIPSI